MTLDPDDPRPPYLQVAAILKAGILTGKYQPGEKLPSQQSLAEHFGVSRMTIQQSLRQLKAESLIVTRTGSGVFVRERTEKPIGLRPHMEAVFESGVVRVSFFGFSGETLHGALQEPLDKVRAGRHTPTEIDLRILIPDPGQPWSLPCLAETGEDSPAFRSRHKKISDRHLEPLVTSVRELADFGLVQKASAEVRLLQTVPFFKLYLVNDEAFFGYYPVSRHTVRLNRTETEVLDLMGKDATLLHFDGDDGLESSPSPFVNESKAWFNSVWNTTKEVYDFD